MICSNDFFGEDETNGESDNNGTAFMFVKKSLYDSGSSIPLSEKHHTNGTPSEDLVWVNGLSYKEWRLGTPLIENLFHLASPIVAIILFVSFPLLFIHLWGRHDAILYL